MYPRGLSTRDIQGHIEELYGIDVSAVTDAVLEEVAAWQNRPLEPVYAASYSDALRVKVRDEGLVRNRAVYLPTGITCDGSRLRSAQDVLIVVVDGLRGFPDVTTTEFPECVLPRPARFPSSVTRCSLARRGRESRWRRLSRPSPGASSAEAAAELDRFEAG